jgi:hypothetical protein
VAFDARDMSGRLADLRQRLPQRGFGLGPQVCLVEIEQGVGEHAQPVLASGRDDMI